MNIVWIIVGVAIMGAIAKLVGWAHQRGARSRLGFVSHQWLADHRVSPVSRDQR